MSACAKCEENTLDNHNLKKVYNTPGSNQHTINKNRKHKRKSAQDRLFQDCIYNSHSQKKGDEQRQKKGSPGQDQVKCLLGRVWEVGEEQGERPVGVSCVQSRV